MSARLVLPAGAPREEWLAERRKGVTASEIAVVMEISPYDSPFNLYHRKKGTIGEDYDDDRLSLGTHMEPWIAERWEADHPEFAPEPGGLYASRARPWQLATPDRLLMLGDGVVDAEVGCCHLHQFGPAPYGGMAPCCDANDCGPCCEECPTCPTQNPPEPPVSVLEIKTYATYEEWGEDGTDKIPVHYRAQLLWQMDVLGLGEGRITCFFLGTVRRRDYVVPYDVGDVDLMRKAARDFLDRVEAGDPPPIDGHSATTTALKELWPDVDADAEATIPAGLARRYAAAKAAAKKAKARVALAENEIRARIGEAKTVFDPAGTKVATRSVYPVSEHVRKASVVDKLAPARTKKERP